MTQQPEMRLVPVEPTIEMLEALAGYGLTQADDVPGWVEGYKAMLAAAPVAPAGSDGEAKRAVAHMREVASDWRRPELAQVEGPNDLKIYGGTIADDIDRWADLLAASGEK